MKKAERRKFAGVLDIAIALAALIALYTLFAPVDLVYMVGGEEVFRQENAFVLSSVVDPFEVMDNGAELEDKGLAFYYSNNGEKVMLRENSLRFRLLMMRAALKSLVKMDDDAAVIIFNAYYN